MTWTPNSAGIVRIRPTFGFDVAGSAVIAGETATVGWAGVWVVAFRAYASALGKLMAGLLRR